MKKSVILLISAMLIFGILGVIYANDDCDQECSDAESQKQQEESDAESEKQQEESDEESAAQQEESDAESASQQSASDDESSDQQEESDAESQKQQEESDLESFLQQAESDFKSKIEENKERKVNLEVISELDENGNTKKKLEFRGIGVDTSLEVEEIEEGEAKIRLSDGNYQDINVMPNTAFKIALEKLRTSNINVRMEEYDDEELAVVYVADADKTVKVLGIFETEYNLEVEIDIESGEINVEDKPWWWIFVEEIDEVKDMELQLIKPIQDIVIMKDEKASLDLNEYFLNAESYSISDSENISSDLDESRLTIIPKTNWTGISSLTVTAFKEEESLEALFNIIVSEDNLSIQTLQSGAILNEPVKWKKKVKIEGQKKVTLKLPKNSENIVIKTDVGVGEILSSKETENDLEIEVEEDRDYEVEYTTSAPYSVEKNISQGKQEITIIGSEEVHYTDVLAFKRLSPEAPNESIKMFWVTESGKTEVELDKYDLNENGLIDYIEWVVPSLSNQTYELELTAFASENFTITTPANNSIHRLNWIYINLTSAVNLNSALVNWKNSSGIINFTMLNDSITHWYRNMTSLSDGNYDFSAWAENLSGAWIESNRIFLLIDGTIPVISMVYPVNTTYSSDVTSINYTYTEMNSDKCWYSIDGGATNSSAVSCGNNFTGLTSIEGNNTWTVYINDTAGNANQSSITFFKDSVYPLIDYGTKTAEDNDVVSQNYIYVNVSVTELNEDTITFLLHNSTGQVDSASYKDSTRIINWTGLSNEVYTYNVTINDTLGNTNTTSKRTITLDTNAPVISFNCDKISVNAGEVITCSCSATSATDPDPTVSYTKNPSTASTGTYKTTCTALDNAGVSSSSSISYTVESVGGGGYPTYRPKDSELSDGYNKVMSKNWKISFKVDDVSHTFKVEEISETNTRISISSENQEATLSIGEEKKFELSKDNYYDVLVKLNSINSNYINSRYFKANFTIQTIHEEISKEIVEKEEIIKEDYPEEEKDLTWLWVIIGIFVLVFIGTLRPRKKR